MASRKLVLGGAGAAALGVRLARALRARWHPLRRRQPAQLEPPAATSAQPDPVAAQPAPAGAKPDPAGAKPAPAAPGGGEPDYAGAAASLRAAAQVRPASPTEPAESKPDLSAAEVAELRGDLRRELERLAETEVKGVGTGFSTPPPG